MRPQGQTEGAARVKLGLIITRTDPETVFNALRLALYSLEQGDEVRIFLEERASFSPDAMTGMEANLRFPGPETMETRIFGRLTAWQNWIFQRPNAVGPEGALKRYGTGQRGAYDMTRV